MTTVREIALELFRAHGMTTMFGNPGLDRAPDAPAVPRRLHLRPRAAGGGRRRDGRRVRPGHRSARAGQPAHRAGRGQRRRRAGQRGREQDAAGRHRGPAGAADDGARGDAHEPPRHRAPPPHREVLRRAPARGRRARGARPGDPRGDHPAAGAGLRLDPHGRLGRRADRPGPRGGAAGGPPDGPGARAAGRGGTRHPGRGARRRVRARSRGRRGRRRGRRVRRRRGARGAALRGGLRPARGRPRRASRRTTRSSAARCRWPSRRWRTHSSRTTSSSSSGPPCSATTPTCRAGSCPRAPCCTTSRPTPTRPPARRWGTPWWRTRRRSCGPCASAWPRRPVRSRGRRPPPSPRRSSATPGTLTPEEVFDVVGAVWPADGVVVDESPSNRAALHARRPVRRPASSFFTTSGGLGFGLPAAVGVALADRSRPVLAAIGDGSMQYAIQALATASALGVPVTVMVLENQRVRDPQVVRGPRGHPEGARAGPAARSTSPRSPRATGCRPRRCPAPTSCAPPWSAGGTATGRAWCRCRSGARPADLLAGPRMSEWRRPPVRWQRWAIAVTGRPEPRVGGWRRPPVRWQRWAIAGRGVVTSPDR